MTDRQIPFRYLFLSLGAGLFIGAFVVLMFQNNSKNNTPNDVASISNQQLLNLEQKLTKLETTINNTSVLSHGSNLQDTESVQNLDMNNSALEQLGDTISNKLSYELDDRKEQKKIEQEQEKIAKQYEQSSQDEQLSYSIFASIQPGAPNEMSNIKEVMQSEQMHAMTAEGRERVVKEIVRMANNGELDIATFFGKGQ
jgi:hypothetical protein